jgi:hypothetical protein
VSGGAAVSLTPVADVANVAGPEEPPEPNVAWDLLHRRYASWYGPTGGLFLFDPRLSEAGAVRVQLGLGAFAGSDYLQKNDHIELADQIVAVNVNVTKGLELYATLANRSTSQTKPGDLTLDALGDVTLGGRLGTNLGRLFAVGGDLRATFINQTGGGGYDWGSTSAALRAALSMDLQQLERPVPLLLRLNVGYVFDNTAVSIEDTENDRYKALSGAASKDDETRHLVTRFERLAMNINRVDRIALGFGVELPLQVTNHFFLHPLLEWQLGLPANRQGYDCPNVASDKNAGTRNSSQDTCYERKASSMPMNLAFGIRVVPPVRGLSAIVGADIGLMGTSAFARELAPNLPWRVLVGFSYDYDARPVQAPAPALAETVAPPPPPPVAVAAAAPTGRVVGTVTNTQGVAIADVKVRFVDLKLSTILTNGEGRFMTEPLPPGGVALELSHPEYQPGRCDATIPPTGGDTTITCALTPIPMVGRISGTVTEAGAGPLAGARVTISGPSTAEATADANGAVTFENLKPGTYQVRVELLGYFIKVSSLQVEPRVTTPLNAALKRKPLAPSIVFSGDVIESGALVYSSDTSTTLTSVALEAIAEVADVLLSRPDLYVQVQGFGPEPTSLARAVGIKQKLVDAGVPESHVDAVAGTKNRIRFILHR